MENERKEFKKKFRSRIYTWVLRLIRFIEKLPPNEVCRVKGRQLLRSGTSILANYAEAGSASSKKEFTNFFNHSLKSANESEIWLFLLRDLDFGDKAELDWLILELQEISSIMARGIITLRKK